jgi:P4 family phage/plasmid primase-like protien
VNFLVPNAAGIPQAMQALERWHLWRWELNPKDNKWAKVPRMVGKERRASSTNASTWTTFSSTMAALNNVNGSLPYDGIGFALEGSGLSFLDVDDCLDAATGQIEVSWVGDLVTLLNTFCEISPSGTGLHIWFSGTFHGPGVSRQFVDGSRAELYCKGRYACCTGHLFPGSPAEPRAYDVQSLYNQLKKGQLGPDQGTATPEPTMDGAPAPGSALSDFGVLNRIAKWKPALRIKSTEEYQGDTETGLRIRLEVCPFDDSHKDAAIFCYPSGPIYQCFHDSCVDRDWRRLCSKFEYVPPVLAPGLPASSDYSEDQLALRFSAAYGKNLRFTEESGKWYAWNNQVWQEDRSNLVLDLSREICRRASLEVDAARGPGKGARLASANTIAHVEKVARSDGGLALGIAEWNPDPWLLNCTNGVIDQRSGMLLPHDRNLLMTKICGIELAPEGTPAPLWSAFLHRISAGNSDLERYLQRVAGYSSTGITTEQCFFFAYGTGMNGKGVFLNTLKGILGDYTRTAPLNAFLASATDRHPCDLASLHGARLVTSSETAEGRRWDESKIKSLTGEDPIACRYMHQNFFEYTPQFKIFIAANDRPGLRSVNTAIRRRMHLIPFTITIPAHEQDKELTTKLRAEWPAILRWCVEGCLEWQAHGLNPPKAVTDATEEYLAEENTIARWIADNCELGSGFTPTRVLFKDWKFWAEEMGAWAGSDKSFSQNLKQVKEVHFKRTATANGFDGIRLRSFDNRYGCRMETTQD